MCCHRICRSSGLQCNERTRNAFECEWQLVPGIAMIRRRPDSSAVQAVSLLISPLKTFLLRLILQSGEQHAGDASV